MSKECIICGRRTITGRKYCYEHRNTNLISSMNNLERAYKRYRLKSMATFIIIIILILMVSSFFIFQFEEEFLIYMAVMSIFALIIIYIAKPLINPLINFIIKNEIKNKKPKFIKFAKGYGETVREEREFRKSIFRA